MVPNIPGIPGPPINNFEPPSPQPLQSEAKLVKTKQKSTIDSVDLYTICISVKYFLSIF